MMYRRWRGYFCSAMSIVDRRTHDCIGSKSRTSFCFLVIAMTRSWLISGNLPMDAFLAVGAGRNGIRPHWDRLRSLGHNALTPILARMPLTVLELSPSGRAMANDLNASPLHLLWNHYLQ